MQFSPEGSYKHKLFMRDIFPSIGDVLHVLHLHKVQSY